MGSDPVALRSLALATAGVLAVEGLARWVIGIGALSPLTGIGLARVIDIAWMALIVSRWPQGWRRIGLGRGTWADGLKRGFIWSLGFGFLAVTGYGILKIAGLTRCESSDRSRLFFHPERRCFSWSAESSPDRREFYFRGFMFGYCRRWGFWPALTLSTVVFTFYIAVHPPPIFLRSSADWFSPAPMKSRKASLFPLLFTCSETPPSSPFPISDKSV